MKSEFELLAGFLAGADAEVEARALESPPEAVQARLRELARGGLAETKREQLLDDLLRHKEWLPWLAKEVKALRTPAGQAPA